MTYVDFEALADAVGLDLSAAWPIGDPDEEAEQRARPFLIRGTRWQPPVTELWHSRDEPLSAFGMSLYDIRRMIHVSDDRADVRLSLLTGGQQGLPIASVEQSLMAMGYVRAPQDAGPWWGPPSRLPETLPRTLMDLPFAATHPDALVFANRRAAELATTATAVSSLAEMPAFTAALAASTGPEPVLQALAMTGTLFATIPDFAEDRTAGELPGFRLVLFTERQQGDRAESEMILVFDEEQDARQAHSELTARWDMPVAEPWLRGLPDVNLIVEEPQSAADGAWTVTSRAVNTVDPDDLSPLPRTAYGRWLETILVDYELNLLWP